MDSNNILIRQVEATDALEYTELINLVWRDTYKHIFPEEVFVDLEDKTEGRVKNFSNIFYNDKMRMCYVAVDKGVIVGVIYGLIKSGYEYFGEQDYADIVSLYIIPEYQGMGIGKKLKDIFEKWARENGAKKYVIGVMKDNVKARRVYEKWGGKLDLHEQDFYKLGVGYDEVFYTYDL